MERIFSVFQYHFHSTVIFSATSLQAFQELLYAPLEDLLLVKEKLSRERSSDKSSHSKPFARSRNRHQVVHFQPESGHFAKKRVFVPRLVSFIQTSPSNLSNLMWLHINTVRPEP